MSQSFWCLQHRQRLSLSMVTSVLEKGNSCRGTNLMSRVNDGAHTLIFGQKFLYSYCTVNWCIVMKQEPTASCWVLKPHVANCFPFSQSHNDLNSFSEFCDEILVMHWNGHPGLAPSSVVSTPFLNGSDHLNICARDTLVASVAQSQSNFCRA